MVRSILKSKSSPPSQSQSHPPPPQPSVSFSKARHHPRLSSTPPPLPLTSSLPSPHVHFPPTPTIVSSTYTAHPSSIYDRAPIEVSPNSCALPERGGRVFHTGSPPVRVKGRHGDAVGVGHEAHVGSYFHPLAYKISEPEDLHDDIDIPSPSSVPQLIRDSCSSSSESDEPADGYGSPHLSPIPMFSNPMPHNALSFLPHAGYPPSTRKKSDGRTRPKLRRRQTPTANHGLCHSRKSSMDDPPSLDGCLGGF